MIITKKKHNEIVNKLDKEIDFLIEEKRKLELIVNQIYRIQLKWKNNKMGNKKAITKIHELFRRDHE